MRHIRGMLQRAMDDLGIGGWSSRDEFTAEEVLVRVRDLKKLLDLNLWNLSGQQEPSPHAVAERYGLSARPLAVVQVDWARQIAVRFADARPEAGGDAMQALATAVTQAADDAPLSRVARAIARQQSCAIQLWATAPAAAEKGRPPGRVICFSRHAGGRRDYFLFYTGLCQPDRAARRTWLFNLAHELGHVSLRHPPRNGPGTESEEIKAHCLAVEFLALDATPARRGPAPLPTLRSIVARVDLPEGEKRRVLAGLPALPRRRPSSPPRGARAVLEDLLTYDRDSQKRLNAAKELDVALAQATQPPG